MVPEAVIDNTRLEEVQKFNLLAGGHSKNTNGEMCIMEAVAYVAGERWSDSPECASPVLASFMRQLNDQLSDEKRQELKPFIAKLVGTRDGRDEERSWLISDWTIRVALPTWLEVSGQNETATKLRALPKMDADVFYENRDWIREIRAEAWERRKKWRSQLKEAITAELRKQGKKPADAAAAADADAAADAAAAVVAAAAADAADLAYGSARWNAIYKAVKKELKPKYEEAIKPTSNALWPTAIELIENLIDLADSDVADDSHAPLAYRALLSPGCEGGCGSSVVVMRVSPDGVGATAPGEEL